MTINSKPRFPRRPRRAMTRVRAIDETDVRVLIEAEEAGNKVVAVIAAGAEAEPCVLQLLLGQGTSHMPLVTVSVSALAARDPDIPPVDLFTAELRAMLPKDADGQAYLFLEQGQTLAVRALDTVSDDVWVTAIHASFEPDPE
jgi:hypothetical protein